MQVELPVFFTDITVYKSTEVNVSRNYLTSVTIYIE